MDKETQFIRTEMLLGSIAMQKLAAARVAVFGVGGVGGYVAEALARSGIGTIDLFDNDTIALSNLNRQIIALHSTIGMAKTTAMAMRIKDINPNCIVNEHICFYTAQNSAEFDFKNYSFVVDAIDTVTSKLVIIQTAQKANVPCISCMGTGNKLNPEMLKISKLEKTIGCPLARTMRYECRKRGIKNVTVLYSSETPIKPQPNITPDLSQKRSVPASTAFVPAAAGLIIAGHVVRSITQSGL